MLQDILSSQLQVIFMPPVHFSIFIVQRGIIIPVMAGFIAGVVAPIPDIIPDIPCIGFIDVVIMSKLLGSSPPPCATSAGKPMRRLDYFICP
jgi:hypothetical protein